MITHDETFLLEGYHDIEDIVSEFEEKLGVKLMARAESDTLHGYITTRKLVIDELPKTEVTVSLYTESEAPSDVSDTSIAATVKASISGLSQADQKDVANRLVTVLGGHTTHLKRPGYLDRKKKSLKEHIDELKLGHSKFLKLTEVPNNSRLKK